MVRGSLHFTVTENETYDSVNNLLVDIYEPEEVVGTVIDIHGGGWFRGDKAKDEDWAAQLAGMGYRVVVPNYRTTQVKAFYPDPLDDMDTLMAWLGGKGLVQEGHVAAVGGSAGGNMAVELAIKYGMPAVSLSGILDIADWLESHTQVEAKNIDSTEFNKPSAAINQDGANDSFYKWFVINYFNGETKDYRTATPYSHVTDHTGPMYLANSLNEFVPVSGVMTMASALAQHQIPVTVRTLPGSRHAKGYLKDVFSETLIFLDRYLYPEKDE